MQKHQGEHTKNPKSKKIKKNNNFDNIVIESESDNDLFNSIVKMKNKVYISNNNKNIDYFEYNLTHTLWNNNVIKDLLEKNNFEIKKVTKGFSRQEATEQDFKITYVVKKC